MDSGAWITLITGMSGSGKTTAVQALEDEGFFCIDNLPPTLALQAVEACLSGPEHRSKIALVLDARSGHLLEQVPSTVLDLRKIGHHVDVIFLDANDEVLVRRYSETRRRHPLDNHNGRTVIESIAAERSALATLRDLATRIVDTSELKGAALRKLVADGAQSLQKNLALTFVSFGFKFGLPVEADLVFDVRHLLNPYFVPELKEFTGRDPAVRDFVLKQSEASELIKRIDDLLRYLMPLYQREGKRYLTVAIGCTGGKHRSVAIAEALGEAAVTAVVAVRHRDLARS